MPTLPYEIRNQIVQCFGTCFHYKDNVVSFLITCGVNRRLAEKDRNLPKFFWSRNLLTDLEELQNGYDLERRILTELCKLRSLPDNKAQNPDAGLNALRKLKALAVENDLFVQTEKQNFKQKRAMAEERARIIAKRAQMLASLHDEFSVAMFSTQRQASGFSLEDILERLFPLFHIEYRKSYRTETQQIDGHFRLDNFDYLVEAKWRVDKPTEQEIGGFKQKVDTKLDATRGLFLSINGYRDEVITQFQGRGSNIILADGEDLIYILEGKVELPDALREKVEKAAQEGNVFYRIREML